MAASPIAAVLDAYDLTPDSAFAGAARPPIYIGQPPETDDAEQQIRAPYTVLEDSGRTRDVQSDNGGPEAGEFTITVYDFDPRDLGRHALAIRFAGRPPKDRAGLDGGTLQLDPPFLPLVVQLVSDRVDYAGVGLTAAGTLKRLHSAELVFRLAVQIDAAG